MPFECSDSKMCSKAHSPNDVRRNPFKEDGSLAYHPKKCSEVFPRSAYLNQKTQNDPTIQISKCSLGNACNFAHSMNEILYHPLKYRTSVCPNLKKNCTTVECPHYHEDRKYQEKRDINQIKQTPKPPPKKQTKNAAKKAK